MAEGESAERETNSVQFRDPKPTRSEERDSKGVSTRASRVGQGAKQRESLMLRKFEMKDELKNYTNKGALYMSIVQIVIGIVCVILGIVAVVVESSGYVSGIGIWGGIVIIVTGVVGLLAYKRKIAKLVVACFAMSLISFVIGGTMLVMSAVFLGSDIAARDELLKTHEFWAALKTPKAIEMQKLILVRADEQTAKIAVNVILILLGIAEIVAAVLQAVISGKVLIIRARKVRKPDGQSGTPLTDMGAAEDDGWGEYKPSGKRLTRTLSETEADREFGPVDPDHIPTKRASYRGAKSGKYSQVATQKDDSGKAEASGEAAAAATADVHVEVGFSDGATANPPPANEKY